MSEKDVLKRFWIQITAGILMLLLSGLGTIFYSKFQTAQNAKEIEKLKTEQAIFQNKAEREFAKKDDDKSIHRIIFQDIQENRDQIQQCIDDNNTKYLNIISKIDKVNQNILQLHSK